MPIRVVVAEDNHLVREAVTRLLDNRDDVEVAGVAEDYDSLLAAVEPSPMVLHSKGSGRSRQGGLVTRDRGS